MTDAISRPHAPSRRATGLAVVLTAINVLAALMTVLSVSVFLLDYDGDDVLAPRITAGVMLAVAALIVVATIFGWRRLRRRPVSALAIMGTPGLLVGLLMIVTTLLTANSISRMQGEWDRAGAPSAIRP